MSATLMQRVAASAAQGVCEVGLFPAAGGGHVPIAATIGSFEQAMYRGWYVLEQDVALTDQEPPVGQGPVLGVQCNIEYLQMLAA